MYSYQLYIYLIKIWDIVSSDNQFYKLAFKGYTVKRLDWTFVHLNFLSIPIHI